MSLLELFLAFLELSSPHKFRRQFTRLFLSAAVFPEGNIPAGCIAMEAYSSSAPSLLLQMVTGQFESQLMWFIT